VPQRLEILVQRAQARDTNAFVELTRRFQHFAFGSALSLVHDFHIAEDVVQEAFVAAWFALPKLSDAAAFPGWLRGIVRHHAFRQVRRKRFRTLPLTEAESSPSDEPAPDHLVEQRQTAAAALAAIAELPSRLREPATLFFVHECSHQDIAVFLGLSTTNVNNRLHAARVQLKKRMLTMIENTLLSHALPDDFSHKIGRLIDAQGGLIGALFDPSSLPDILTELDVSDEANRRAVNVQVIQRTNAGVIRGFTTSPIEGLPHGSTIMNSGRRVVNAIAPGAFNELIPLLAGQEAKIGGGVRLIETGIKVIDVMCPFVSGGSVAMASEHGSGAVVVMEELARRLSNAGDKIFLFVLMPPPSSEWPHELEEGFSWTRALKKDGYSEGTVGAVQTFFLRGQESPWTIEDLTALESVDTVIHLSRAQGRIGIWPAIDPLTSLSRALESEAVSDEHRAIATRVREALAALRAAERTEASADSAALDRARKLEKFFAQPFFAAEPWTRRPGSYVGVAESLQGCTEILEGLHDDLPIDAFYFRGGMKEIRREAARV
jgi:RNA polymerase sigma factor (sigma-70 family)